jgi:hypothetical protein
MEGSVKIIFLLSLDRAQYDFRKTVVFEKCIAEEKKCSPISMFDWI